jgi:hypothetical protein
MMRSMEDRATGRRQLVLGLAALAVLAGAGLLLRRADCGRAVMGERFVIPYRPADDVTRADRTFDLGPLRLEVAVERPIEPMRELWFDFRIQRDGRPLAGLEPELTLNMDMDMGRIVYRPRFDAGSYRTRVVVPVCIYGGKRWYGRLRFARAGRRYEKVFLFDVP